MKYAYNIVFSVVGLGFFHYAVLQRIDFFYFLETFILGTLLQLDSCHLWFTRHDTLSQNDVLTQNSIIRVIIEVSRCNQTHPKYCVMFKTYPLTISTSTTGSIEGLLWYQALPNPRLPPTSTCLQNLQQSPSSG